jgi:hypothetical protein
LRAAGRKVGSCVGTGQQQIFVGSMRNPAG